MSLKGATIFTILLIIIGTVQYHIILHIHLQQDEWQVLPPIVRDREFKERLSKLGERGWSNRKPDSAEEDQSLPRSFRRVTNPPSLGIVRLHLNQDRNKEDKAYRAGLVPPVSATKAEHRGQFEQNSRSMRPSSEQHPGTENSHTLTQSRTKDKVRNALNDAGVYSKVQFVEKGQQQQQMKPSDSNLDYKKAKQLLFQYINDTYPQWLGDKGHHYGPEEHDYEDQDELSVNEDRKINYDDFELVETKNGIKIVRKPKPTFGPEILVENYTQPFRKLTAFEEEGGDVMFTLRTTLSYHQMRLPLLFETWMTKVDCRRIFLVTDGHSLEWETNARRMGLHYVIASCGKRHNRNELCCKAGVELALMFRPENKNYNWLCHIDDDIYVNLEPLVRVLSKFDPRKEPVYFGRSGSEWRHPRRVKQSAKLGRPGQRYHFAVGGMYCLSRAMLERAKPYLVGGDVFAHSCSKTLEPEDVTMGFIVGVVLNYTLSRTELIHTHGLHLVSSVDPATLKDQIAFSYGFGSTKWGEDSYNAIYVPDGLYNVEQDESQFRSLYCHLYPKEPKCIARLQMLQQNYPDFMY